MLNRLFGRRAPDWPPRGPITEWPIEFSSRVSVINFDSAGRHFVDVVGESAYQGSIDRIAGGRTPNGARVRDHTAVLLPEPSNRYDGNAVRVAIANSDSSQSSVLVGYLSREDAVAYRLLIDRAASVGRLVACAASLTGGWDRGTDDRGSFGVRLHIDSPTGAMAELESNPDCLRPAWEGDK